MTDINKLAERLRELSELYIPARHDPESALLLQTAANELERLETMCDGQRESLREHMAMARDAVSECDKLRARIAELERERDKLAMDNEALRGCIHDEIAANLAYRDRVEAVIGKVDGEDMPAQCDRIIAELAKPIRWRPISEAPKRSEGRMLVWIDGMAELARRPVGATHFAEIVGPGGEPC